MAPADGSRVFVLTAVRHHDGLTAALREIGAKANEIPEFIPLGARPLDHREHRSLDQSVTFAEDSSQIRRHHTPAVISAQRDLARATLHHSGPANIASGRRAHTHPHPPRNSMNKPG